MRGIESKKLKSLKLSPGLVQSLVIGLKAPALILKYNAYKSARFGQKSNLVKSRLCGSFGQTAIIFFDECDEVAFDECDHWFR